MYVYSFPFYGLCLYYYRIFRALFEIAISRHWITLATKLLNLCKMIEKQIWASYHPLRQFPNLSLSVIHKLEETKVKLSNQFQLNTILFSLNK
jgi:hypothetical protein